MAPRYSRSKATFVVNIKVLVFLRHAIKTKALLRVQIFFLVLIACLKAHERKFQPTGLLRKLVKVLDIWFDS